ncbi:MAG TPA: hypothetical protein VGQ83_26130 [Polyangia bacterium]|jgi:hypothetical protein
MTEPTGVSSGPSRSGRCARRRARAALVALLFALLPLAPALAKRVAVAELEGPRAAAAEQAVVEALRGDGHEIVGAGPWKEAGAQVGPQARAEEALAAAARKVRVSAIVLGKVQPGPRTRRKREARTAVLVLTVHDGRTGALLETIEVPLARGAVDAQTRRVLAAGLLPVIARSEAPGEPPATAAPADEETPDQAAARRAARQAATAAAAPGVAAAAPARPGRGPTVVVGAGASLWARRLSVTPGGSANGYQGSPIPPGVRVEAEVYPLAAVAGGLAGDVGVGGYFDQTWRSSQFQGATGAIDVATTQARWSVDLRLRRQLGARPFSPTLRAAVSVSHLAFRLSGSDRSRVDGLNLPDVAYLGVGPTVGIVVPLGRPALRVGASFTYLVVTGPASNAPAGTTYDRTWGVDSGLHLDYQPVPWLLARAQAGLTYYGTTVTPAAPATTTRVADLYVGGFVSVAYVH